MRRYCSSPKALYMNEGSIFCMDTIIWFFGTLFLLAALIIAVHLYTRKHEKLIDSYRLTHNISKLWMIIPVVLYVLIIFFIVMTDSFREMFAPVIALIMLLSIIFALIKAMVDVHQAKKLHHALKKHRKN